MKKTYAVRGLMEWQITLPTGCVRKPGFTITFEGGQITGYGVAPARFTTSDPAIQNLIEGTKWFADRRIYIERATAESHENKSEAGDQ